MAKILSKKTDKRTWTVELDAFGFFLRSSNLTERHARALFKKIADNPFSEMEAVTLFHGNVQYDEVRSIVV